MTEPAARAALTRRALLGVGLAGGGALAAAAMQRRAPGVIQPELTPERFGATGRDAAADTLGWNRVVAEAARTGRPVVARGTYILRAPRESLWYWHRVRSAPVRVAVRLQSGAKIQGAGATIIVGRPEVPPIGKDERHLLFGTDGNVRPGTVRDVSIEGLTFDFRDEFGPVHRYTYAAGVVGVDGFTRRDCRFVSTGARGGRGLMSENVRRRADSDLSHENVIQGVYTRYEQGVDMRRIAFDGFDEALDFDGPCWDVRLDGLRFANGSGEAQCIDTGGGARWLVTNVDAVNTGAVIYVYLKPNAWPTYAQWLANDGYTDDYVTPEQMTIRGVRARNAGLAKRSTEAARIGNRRTERMLERRGALDRSPRAITLEDWTLDGGARIVVNDCEDVALRRIRMRGTRVTTGVDGSAAIVLRQAEPGLGGRLTGTVSDVVVENPEGIGLSVEAGEGLSISNVTVRGVGMADPGDGVVVRRASGARAAPRIAGVTIAD